MKDGGWKVPSERSSRWTWCSFARLALLLGDWQILLSCTFFLLLTSKDARIRCSGDDPQTFLSLCRGPGTVLGGEEGRVSASLEFAVGSQEG